MKEIDILVDHDSDNDRFEQDVCKPAAGVSRCTRAACTTYVKAVRQQF
jgi:hypothetical protein